MPSKKFETIIKTSPKISDNADACIILAAVKQGEGMEAHAHSCGSVIELAVLLKEFLTKNKEVELALRALDLFPSVYTTKEMEK